MVSPLETAFRRTVDAGFHQAIAFGTLSILGMLVSVPLLTVGPATFGVAHGIVNLSRRGAQHSVGETTGLFVEGVRRYLSEGIALSAFLLLYALGIAANVWVLATGSSIVLVAFVILSTLTLSGCALIAMHAVALIVCGLPPRSAVRDGAVLLFRFPLTTMGQGIVLTSLLVLGHLTVVGWALIGFAVAVSFVVRTTDGLYSADGGDSPLRPG